VSEPSEPLYLDADPVRVSQAISNLLNNATKYTDRGGHIVLTVSREDGNAKISVKDEGRGLSAEVLPHVFDIFMQVTGDGHTPSGLGLGLTLVRALVELHGGSVEARSEGAGKGSEFIIRLPLAAGPVAVRSESSLPVNLSRHRIIVVDDNQDTSSSLGLLLSMVGAEVRVLYDGASALALFDSFRPTVVILDLGMPVMDGLEVARQIRAHVDHSGVTLIAMTGWAQQQDRERALEVFDHYLVKPVAIGTLQDVLKSPSPERT
jgi:CheY-like chemotaxis protein/anti-sigma regulatory factor (Ser/Thr protein kinase)